MDARVLRKNLVELLEGKQAHVAPAAALEGLPPALRNVRPGKGGVHSVYEELEHMRISQEDILRYTLDPTWQSPEWPVGYWPADNDTLTAKTWKSTVTRFFADLDELIALVKNPRRDLTEAIPHGEGRTYLRGVLLVADHNAYHLGQIVLARKLLGSWRR